MRKDIALKLREKALEVARTFSSSDREKNITGEIFEVETIKPLSEFTASVTFVKSTHKRSLAFFYWVECMGGYWAYFFPTDSHILGMSAFTELKQKVEEVNYGFNFIEV